ncbi:hypothetical protein PUN4_420037 [Paraburkholderia unamae]|nr:hypothetical protein PUN4_420037 [Paraburkholderia unamae]
MRCRCLAAMRARAWRRPSAWRANAGAGRRAHRRTRVFRMDRYAWRLIGIGAVHYGRIRRSGPATAIERFRIPGAAYQMFIEASILFISNRNRDCAFLPAS